MEAIWGLIREEAESVAKDLNIPYSTTRIDDVLLRKEHFIYDVLHGGGALRRVLDMLREVV